MADLTDLLQGQLSGAVLESLTSSLGAKNPAQTQSATNGAMSILLNALAKNASKPEGASALGAALDRDHDGSVLDDLMGMIGGQAKPKQPKALDGAGILGHILGGKQNGAIDMLSKMSGLNNNQSLGLLIKLAPILMGALGKMKKTENVNPSGLPDILSGAATKMNRQSGSNGGLIKSFLDQDGDGNLNNEIKKVGFSLLKNLFRRR